MRLLTTACVLGLFCTSPLTAAQTRVQLGQGGGVGSAPATLVGGGQTAGPPNLIVTTMPGYPNLPRLSPSQRHPARPDTDVVIWGSVNHGNGSGVGANYSWSFSHGPEVQVVTDGDLTGMVTDTRFIPEVVRFELQGASTAALVTAVLHCDLGGGMGSREVEIAVISNADPSSNTQLQQIEFNRQVAVENGLRYLYLNGANGVWNTNSNNKSAATAFSVWAFEVHGHVPINDPDEDVYAPLVRLGLRALTENDVAEVNAIPHARANVARGATIEGIADQNANGRAIKIPAVADDHVGYELPMVGSALVASLAPDLVVEAGDLQGLTLRTVVEDLADRVGGGMTTGSPPNRGGWIYSMAQNQPSDMSINSWMYVFLEGAESEFGVDVPDWIKQEAEYTLVSHQANAAGPQKFGYRNTALSGVGSPGNTTTGGGLSGLVFSETAGPFVTPGEVIGALNPPLNTIEAKREAALAFVGANWGAGGDQNYGNGNRGNPYCMWTVARALRLTATAQGLPTGQVVDLVNGGVAFDWETGYQHDTGTVAPPGAREGYFPYLIRTQLFSGTNLNNWGRWTNPNATFSTAFTTAAYVLVLGRDVFLASGCDEAVAGPVNMIPPPLSTFPTGETIVLSGLAVPATLDRQILGVLVNGQVPQVVDAQWNFFQTITVQEGLNTHTITIADSCSTAEFVHQFYGAEGGEIIFDNLSVATPLLEATYTNTSWNPGSNTMRLDAEACNLDQDVLRPPVVLVLEGLQPNDAQLLGADGINEDGHPYVRFMVGADGLMPGECSQLLSMEFLLQQLSQLDFQEKWFAEGQLPPEVTSIPVVSVLPETSYSYDVEAVDPNGTPLTWSLPTGPLGMTIDPLSGLLSWTPTPAIHASHQVRVRVSDTDGDYAEQAFSLSVTDVSNHAPFFVSLPVTTAGVGMDYEYLAIAFDFDNDPLSYQLLEWPAGMTIDPNTGLVFWQPDSNDSGLHSVVIEAADPNGGSATQSFTVEVAEGM